MACNRPTFIKSGKQNVQIKSKTLNEDIVDISDDSDIDILYEDFTPLVPGTPAFILQQVSLLENLQKNRKHIPTDYNAFLDCVKSLKVNYQPAVILGAWKVLLDKHLSIINLGSNVANDQHKLKCDQTISVINCDQEGETSNNKKRAFTGNRSNFKSTVTNKAHHGNLKSVPSNNSNLKSVCLENNNEEKGDHKKNKKDKDSSKNRSFELNDKCIKKNVSRDKEKMFIKESVSCPDILIAQNESNTKVISNVKRQNTSKRKSEINEVSPSRRKRKNKESNPLASLCSSVLGAERITSKNKMKRKLEMDKCGLSKSELIKFFKKQSKEKIVEEKKLKKQIMEVYHDRLVDILVPKYLPSDFLHKKQTADSLNNSV